MHLYMQNHAEMKAVQHFSFTSFDMEECQVGGHMVWGLANILFLMASVY